MHSQKQDTWVAVVDLISGEIDNKAFCIHSKDGKDDTVASWLYAARQELQW